MKVALCTISSRKDCCLKTINSLLKQTVPCEIHLLLSEEPFLLDEGFPGKKIWPELESLPITIHWVPNWASYRKTVSFMKLFPNEQYLAIDDDEEFHPGFMKFIEDHYYEGCFAFRATRYCDDPYNRWESMFEPFQRSIYAWSKGNGGVIYDSALFQDDSFFDSETFLKLAPTSDDVWVNLWRIKHNIPLQVYPIIHSSMPQETRLWFLNENMNDSMIQKVKDHFQL